LFAAPTQNNPLAIAAEVSSLELRPLPHSLEAAAYESSPAAVAVAAAIAAATGAAAPTLASHEVWSRLTAALHTHDWHAARDAKHFVEEAQRVRSYRACRVAPLISFACWQEARKVRDNAQVAWVPRFFEAHAERAGGWVLKAGVKDALTASLAQAPAEQGGAAQPLVSQPATPASAARRSADGVNAW
jgi:hypothetical protein